jgi:hypothetical protein
LILLLAVVAGCQEPAPVESLPGVRRTLDRIGVRLSQIKSERELTTFATRQEAVLALLEPSERSALGRNCVRFHADVPVIVAVASLKGATPFWVEDQGFRLTDLTLQTEDGEWVVHRKWFPRGWVGLGVNGLDRRPTTHYAAFLRAASDRPLDVDKLGLVQDDDAGWRSLVAHPGVSASSGTSRPFRALPKELDGAILLQPAHDRRHAALLAKGRVWKSHVVSRDTPDQTVVSFGADPARELVWSWRTSARVEGSVVRIVPAKYETAESDPTTNPDLDGVRLVEGDAHPVRSEVLNDPLINRHTATVGGLEPDTMYYYSLGDGTTGRWGPWRTVRTGPDRPRRLEFLYLGDAQTGLEEWGTRLTAAFRRHPGMDCILLAGDLVDRGNERTNWDHFFLRAEPLFDRVPVMPAVGNHEYLDQGPRHYNAFFRLPKNGPEGVTPGLVYHFQYGGAFFAVLDSTLAVMSPNQARNQAEWLDRVLAESTAEWKFVLFHHTIYPSHPWRDNPVIREHWVPIFDKHHVDMVLQGHDHAYLRTHPMKANQRVSTSAEGTTYVVAVSGDKFSGQGTREYIEFGQTELSTYQTLEIDEIAHRLTYRAWGDDGEAVDSLIIDKPAPDARRSLVVGTASTRSR